MNLELKMGVRPDVDSIYKFKAMSFDETTSEERQRRENL